MTNPIFKSIAELITSPKGLLWWYDNYWSICKHLKTHDDAIANLEVGSAPGVFAPYDTRFYVVETGFASNAYTASLSPVATGQALPTGYRIHFMPSTANTGAATLDVGSTDGALDIKKIDRSSTPALAALVADDLRPSIPTLLEFDGTQWVVLSFFVPPNAEIPEVDPPVYIGYVKGLSIETYNGGRIDIAFDEALLVNSDGEGVIVTSITNDKIWPANSGVTGIDTGSEASSTWYYMYLIHNTSNGYTYGILSTSASSPTLPSGYTHYLYFGAIYNDGSSNLEYTTYAGNIAIRQRETEDLSGGTSTSYSAVTLHVPPHIRLAHIEFNAAGNDYNDIYLSYNGTHDFLHMDSSNGSENYSGFVPLTSSRQIYYKTQGGSTYLRTVGWLDPKVVT